QPGVDLGLFDEVIIVQDEDHAGGERRLLVEQGDQHRLGGGRLGRLEQLQRARRELGLDGLQPGDQVGLKAHGVIVVRVQGKPGEALAPRVRPFGEQGGLAQACRRGDERQVRSSPPKNLPGAADRFFGG
ncbi:MAG TPA: hypothetical protein VGJ97_13145, partial [Anaerolineaceae bacterium]